MWDVFISHASEDKESVARPLAEALSEAGLKVWYDEFALTLGDSLRRSIDYGLAKSRYGIVILSPNFFAKEWPQRELDGLTSREISSSKVILPIWHNLEFREVVNFSPTLADKLGVSTSKGMAFVVKQILSVFCKIDNNINSGFNAENLPENTGIYSHNQNRVTKILFLGANPSKTSRLRLDDEFQKIQTNLKLSKNRENLSLKQEWALSTDTLMQTVLDESPDIIHFSGHGKQDGIILQNEIGEPKTVTGEALSSLFELFKDRIKCVVLNSCFSHHQAKAIKLHIPYVIGMKSSIPDKVAISFSTGFYKALGAGRDIPFSFKLGVTAIKLEGSSDDSIPILL